MRIGDILAIAAAICPDRVALLTDGESLTFAELEALALARAAELQQAGLAPGDRVAVLDVNTPELVVSVLGAGLMGAVAVPLNYRARPDELAGFLAESGASLLAAAPRYLENATAAAARVPGLSVVRLARPMASTRPGLPDLTPDQPLVLLFTAGTTGAPKAVPLSHASFTSYLLENVNPADPDIHQTALLSMPLFHVAGFQSLLSAIYGGRTTVLLSQFRAPDWLVAVERHRVTHAVVVPTMLKQVLDHPAFGSTDLSSLQQVTYGAAAMPLPVIRQAIERLPHVRFMNAFGQTETASTITALGPEDHRLDGPPHEVERKLQRLAGSIGKPLAGVEVAVVDGDGQPVAPGTVGQIAARGERVMRGYWNRPDTEGPVLANGWILTGDLGWMDEDGYFFLAGRERDIIKRGGEMISPEEVENVLLLHPGVADVAVIGIRDEEWGERVRAIVVPAGGEKPSPEELIEFCRSRLASYKKPESVVFAKGLPRNDLGKLLRQQLRQQYG